MNGKFLNSFRGEVCGRRHWRLVTPLRYVAPDRERIVVPAEEVTDGASVPRKMLATMVAMIGVGLTAGVAVCNGHGWLLVAGFIAAATVAIWRLPHREEEMAAAAIHDWLYRQQRGKWYADWVFYHALRASGLAVDQAFWYWAAVSFSFTAWWGYRHPKLRERR